MRGGSSKAALFGAVAFTSFTIWAVHFQQNQERQVTSGISRELFGLTNSYDQSMYKGVLKDDERRREKMQQREDDLLESQRKRELYERVQTVGGTDATAN